MLSFEIKTCYLDIPYEMRTEAKKYRCFYVIEQKLWTCRKTDDDDEDKREFMTHYQQVYLNVSFADKDEVKSKGGKWDGNAKKWYTYFGNEELKKFM